MSCSIIASFSPEPVLLSRSIETPAACEAIPGLSPALKDWSGPEWTANHSFEA